MPWPGPNPVYFAFFFLLCIPYLGDSKHTAMTSYLYKRQVGDDQIQDPEEDPSDPCWKFTVGYPSQGVFFSPGYPDNYPSNANCLKVIEAPEGKIIRLDFRDKFEMESDTEDCRYDSLEVRDGQHGYNYRLGKFCQTFPEEILSSDRFLWLRFISDDSIEYSGFKAVYSFIDKPGDVNSHKLEKCLFLKNGSEGWVNRTDISNETTMLHQSYNEKLDCMFIISVKEGWELNLQFLQYKMDRPNECESNYIEIYPNVTLLPNRTGHFCGSIAKQTTVHSNVSHIRFVAEPKAFNTTFAILWTAFRQIKKDESCADDEFDCDDLTCIPEELKCNEHDNCRYKNDEDKEGLCIEHTSVLGKLFAETHMIAIVALFFIILAGMCTTFVYNCSKKLIHDHRTIKAQMAASRASRLDQLGKAVSATQLSGVPPQHGHVIHSSHSSHSSDERSHSHSHSFPPETELMPILRPSSSQDIQFPEMRDSECQTRESLFQCAAHSSGGESMTPPPPPPPPVSRPPHHSRCTASPGFTTFGKGRFRAEAVIELNKRSESGSGSAAQQPQQQSQPQRPYSVQSAKSAPDVIVTH